METGRIIQFKKSRTIVLNPKGEFVDIPRRASHGSIGQEIVFVRETKVSRVKQKGFLWKPVLSVAMIAVVCLFTLFSGVGSTEVHAYVSVDIKSSVEFALNEESRIVDVYSYNRDGDILLSKIEVKGEKFGVVIEKILVESEKVGHFDGDNDINFTTSFVKDSGEEVVKIKQELFKEIDKVKKENQEYIVNDYHASKYLREHSRNEKVSLYKMALLVSLEQTHEKYGYYEFKKRHIAELELELKENGGSLVGYPEIENYVKTKGMFQQSERMSPRLLGAKELHMISSYNMIMNYSLGQMQNPYAMYHFVHGMKGGGISGPALVKVAPKKQTLNEETVKTNKIAVEKDVISPVNKVSEAQLNTSSPLETEKEQSENIPQAKEKSSAEKKTVSTPKLSKNDGEIGIKNNTNPVSEFQNKAKTVTEKKITEEVVNERGVGDVTKPTSDTPVDAIDEVRDVVDVIDESVPKIIIVEEKVPEAVKEEVSEVVKEKLPEKEEVIEKVPKTVNKVIEVIPKKSLIELNEVVEGVKIEEVKIEDIEVEGVKIDSLLR